MIDSSIDCVLFDLDGTLVDSAPDLLANFRIVCKPDCLKQE